MQKWSVNGLSRMALFALRDIPAEEELSYDYNFSLYNETEGQVMSSIFHVDVDIPCFHSGNVLFCLSRAIVGVSTAVV